MNISELRSGQEKVNIEAVITDMEEPREFNKFGRIIRVANAEIEDDSGKIKLTLWNQDIDKAKQGMKVKVTNGFVNDFKGEKQLTGGKFGKIEFGEVSESEIPSDKPSKKEKKQEEIAKVEDKSEEKLDEQIDEEGSEDF